MSIIGKLYEPYDNSFAINVRNGRSALLIQEHNKWYSPDDKEDGASFQIVSEPYEEEIYGVCWYPKTYTFVNIKSSNTGNIYRVLYIERRVI